MAEANVRIEKELDKISSISVSMPTWSRVDDNGNLSVTIPLFGLKTIATDEEDSEEAIKEAIVCFCIASEQHGQGFKKELEALGWKSVKETKKHIELSYFIESKNVVLENIMETGDLFAFKNLELV